MLEAVVKAADKLRDSPLKSKPRTVRYHGSLALLATRLAGANYNCATCMSYLYAWALPC
jgi:hypothetical protein